MRDSKKEWMKRRKSVRTFDGRTLTLEDRQFLEEMIASLRNPFDVPVTLRLLKAKEHGLSSPVIVGAEEYLAAKVERVPNYEIAFGYTFEKACLSALSRGIGTVMLAASLSRSAFEKAMEVKQNEVLPVASPVGYPAEKRSVRERLMRKGLRADDRKPFEKLFFRGSFENGLGREAAGSLADALEAVRWAPSAGNGQPWRVVLEGNQAHFYEAKTLKDSSLGDIQKVDLGIALAHFHLVMEEDGMQGVFAFADPGIATPENTHYIVTYRWE